MCCLFGLIDTKLVLSAAQKSKLLHHLATASEKRGTDASGIAYKIKDRIYIYKRPVSGHRLHFRARNDTITAMGHARMTTQGNEKKNYNNHPFLGVVGNEPFALAHNGILCNDEWLKNLYKLPKTKIETDSFVAVQMLEQFEDINFKTLADMAEKLEGSFTFTVLDNKNNLYFIKGDNPICIYYYPKTGIYVYASTKDILNDALMKTPLFCENYVEIKLDCGDILKIESDGTCSQAKFQPNNIFKRYTFSYSDWYDYDMPTAKQKNSNFEKEYVEELKSVAQSFGYSPRYIDTLLADGFSTDDIENLIYCGEW